jgi:hypothetical protein
MEQYPRDKTILFLKISKIYLEWHMNKGAGM